MGPLHGVRVVEMAGLGPGPFCAMLLADMGADVVRVHRPSQVPPPDAGPSVDVLARGRRSVALDLKHPRGRELLLALVDRADALVEGYRPGVMERLGAGPDVCLGRNPRLVYGRMTGWGQDGHYAATAGHDINYLALSGVLGQLRRPGGVPLPPMNLLADFGGGGLVLAFGLVCALFEARSSGQGQVIDAAMVDGAAQLMTMQFGWERQGRYDPDHPGTSYIDMGSHFYDVYETADGRFVSFGAIEPQFYAVLLERLGLADDPAFADQMDRSRWPELKERIAAVVRTRTRDEWTALLQGSDACFAPVLTMHEAPTHPHNAARGTFVEVEGIVQPAPAPRLSRTPAAIQRPPAQPGQHTDEVLRDWLGLDEAALTSLRDEEAIV